MHVFVFAGFRECLIFAFSCPRCGAKNSEIKAAGAYGEAGRRWIIEVRVCYYGGPENEHEYIYLLFIYSL